MPVPDEIVRDEEGATKLAIYGFENAEILERAVDGVLDLIDLSQHQEFIDLKKQQLVTFKMMLEGMRASIR